MLCSTSIYSDNAPDKNSDHVLVFDTGGGRNATVTTSAWKILQRTNHRMAMHGCQDKGPPKICPIVNAVTKAFIPLSDVPILLTLNYATLINDPDERESLCVRFEHINCWDSC